jgi:PAS domain-containing protein
METARAPGRCFLRSDVIGWILCGFIAIPALPWDPGNTEENDVSSSTIAPPPKRGTGEFARGNTRLLMASLDLRGNVRFLYGAWEQVLGRSLRAKISQPFHELVPLDRGAAESIVDMLLDRTSPVPVEFNIRSESGKVRRFLWHRRFAATEQLMYIAGEEIESPQAMHASADRLDAKGDWDGSADGLTDGGTGI